jgi:hypothetical protein
MYCEAFYKFDYDVQDEVISLTFTDLRPGSCFEMKPDMRSSCDFGIQFIRDERYDTFTYQEVSSDEGEDNSDERYPEPLTKFFMTWKEIYDEYDEFFSDNDSDDSDHER